MRKNPSGLAKLAGILSLGLASLLPSCNTFECNAPQSIPTKSYSAGQEYQRRLDQLKGESIQLARGMNGLSNKDLEDRIFFLKVYGMDIFTPINERISPPQRVEYDEDRMAVWEKDNYLEIGKLTCQITYENGKIKEIFLGNPTSMIGLKRTGDFYIGQIMDITNKESPRYLGDYVFEEKELRPLIVEMQNLRARLPKENPRRKEQEENRRIIHQKLDENKPLGSILQGLIKKSEDKKKN